MGLELSWQRVCVFETKWILKTHLGEPREMGHLKGNVYISDVSSNDYISMVSIFISAFDILGDIHIIWISSNTLASSGVRSPLKGRLVYLGDGV